MEMVELGGEPRELYALRPDRMKVVPGRAGWPEAYEYSVDGRVATFPCDPVRGVAPILHMKLFHPTDDHYGMSPVEAAAFAVDIHNAAGQWNKALLDNAARPSGALVYKGGEGARNLTEDQFERLKRELTENYQGAANAGRAAAARRRARLDGHGTDAEGHGFHRGEARGGPRNCSRLRRAAHADRHSGGQHVFQLSGSEPDILAADRSAARLANGAGRSRGGSGRASAKACGSDTTRIRSRRFRRNARRCGRAWGLLIF